MRESWAEQVRKHSHMSTHFNHSRLKLFRENPRAYYWYYESEILGGRGIRSPHLREPLVLGTLVHAGLAHLYAGESLDKAMDWVRVTLELELQDHNLDTLTWEYWHINRPQYVCALLEDYWRWAEPRDTFTPIQIESEGSAEIGTINGTSYHGVFRADLVTAEEHGIRIWDHKTRGGSADANYLESWMFSQQLWGYSALHGRQVGQPVKGYTVNVIRKLAFPQKRHKVCSECKGQGTLPCSECNRRKHTKDCTIGLFQEEATGTREVSTPCPTCSTLASPSTGLVPFEPAEAFVRVSEPFNEHKEYRWQTWALDTIREIVRQREMFESEPPRAWPINPESYFQYGRSPLTDVDFNTDPDTWWKPHQELLDRFIPRAPDYVDDKGLIREEIL